MPDPVPRQAGPPGTSAHPRRPSGCSPQLGMTSSLGSPGRMTNVVIVATTGDGSMDRFGQDLAARMPAAGLITEVGRRSADVFGEPLLDRRAVTALAPRTAPR